MADQIKPGDPGYGTAEPPKAPPPKKLPNKPSWKDWQNPNRWKNDPQVDNRRPPEAVSK